MLETVEYLLNKGLEDESDYQILEDIYTKLSLPKHAEFISGIKKIRFPDGFWKITEKGSQLLKENNPSKAIEISKDLFRMDSISDSKMSKFQKELYTVWPLYVYWHARDLDGFKANLVKFGYDHPERLYFLKNSVALYLINQGKDLKYADSLIHSCMDWVKKELKSPTKRPKDFSPKQWQDYRQGNYTTFTNTYARLLIHQGNFKKAYLIMKGALEIEPNFFPDYVDTYLLAAKETLTEVKLKNELEQVISSGRGTAMANVMLEKLYTKEKGSNDNFEDYLTKIKEGNNNKILEHLKEQMINVSAEDFELRDVDGKTIKLSDFKGQIVILDFWATWCGPCKASFPAMKRAQEKYGNSENIKFLFINTLENGKDKEGRVKRFLNESKWPFDVLIDVNNEVVRKYGINSIPVKLIIDKYGAIRFRSVGYGGNDEKLVDEIGMMIQLLKEQP